MNGTTPERLAECAERIGYSFTNPELLRHALIHRSWQAEHDDSINNERLEFLGDAILGWVVADLAFHKLSDMPEGKLSDLRISVVNMHALAAVATELQLGEFILLGKGEDAAGGREKSSILADALEAVIGAVYMDGGSSAAFAFVERLFAPELDAALPHLDKFDAKSRLQELCGRLGLNAPHYVTEGEGPDHERVFTATVLVNGTEFGMGTGRTKKAAEQIAATHAYDALAEEGDA